MGIVWFRWLIVRGRAVATRSHVRFQAVQSPCMCAERLSVASPYMSVSCPLEIPFSVRVLSLERARGIGGPLVAAKIKIDC